MKLIIFLFFLLIPGPCTYLLGANVNSSENLEICADYLKLMKLRGPLNTRKHCLEVSYSNALMKMAKDNDSNYFFCVQFINKIVPLDTTDYFKKCLDKNFQKNIMQYDFKVCVESMVRTGRSYNYRMDELCTNPESKKTILSSDFMKCVDLLNECHDTENLIRHCTNNEFLKILSGKKFKQCLDFRIQLGEVNNSIRACSNDEYQKKILSDDFKKCVYILQKMNFKKNILSKCTNYMERSGILSRSYPGCVMKLMSEGVKFSEKKCLKTTYSKLIDSENFDICLKKLKKLSSVNPIYKCSNGKNVRLIISPKFDKCITNLQKYQKENLDYFCLKNKITSLRSKQKFEFCANELKKYGRRQILDKCHNEKFLKKINSSDYLQCKSNFITLNLKSIAGYICTDENMERFIFRNEDIICLSQKINEERFEELVNAEIADHKTMEKLNLLFSECIK